MVRLQYEGTDSPRGKCYFAAWEEDRLGFGFVGWGSGAESRVAQRKVREKGYREVHRYEVDDVSVAATDQHVYGGLVRRVP